MNHTQMITILQFLVVNIFRWQTHVTCWRHRRLDWNLHRPQRSSVERSFGKRKAILDYYPAHRELQLLSSFTSIRTEMPHWRRRAQQTSQPKYGTRWPAKRRSICSIITLLSPLHLTTRVVFFWRARWTSRFESTTLQIQNRSWKRTRVMLAQSNDRFSAEMTSWLSVVLRTSRSRFGIEQLVRKWWTLTFLRILRILRLVTMEPCSSSHMVTPLVSISSKQWIWSKKLTAQRSLQPPACIRTKMVRIRC